MSSPQEQFEQFSTNRKPWLAANAAYKWGSMLINILVLFFMTPFIIDTLGKYGYGVWTIITSLIGYYGLLNLGITSAVSRYVSLNLGEKNLSSLTITFNTAFMTFLLTGVAAVLVSQTAAPLIASIFKVTSVEEFVTLVKIMGFTVAVTFPASVLISVLIAHELYGMQSLVAILSSVLRAGLTVYFLLTGHGIEGLAYAFLITASAELVVYFFLLFKICPWVKFSPVTFSGAMLKKLLIFGLPTLVMTVSSLMRTNLDSFVIGSMIGIEQVAVYSVAALIIRQVFSLANSGLGVFTPRFSRMLGEKRDSRPLFSSSLYFAAVLAFTAGAGIFLFGNQLIYLWLGDGFAEALPVLWVLMFCYVITIMQIPGYTMLMALNKHKIFAAITFFEGVCNVVLSIWLAPKYGILGVAMGTAIPMLLVKIVLQPYFTIRATKISYLEYLRPFAIPFALGTGGILVPLYFQLPQLISSFGWILTLASAAAVCGLLLAAILGTAKVLQPRLLRLT